MIRFFICGSALTGQPDHENLGGARLIAPVRTAARYRLHAVGDGRHPGVYEVSAGGISVAGELYEMTAEQHDVLMAGEPPDLYEGDIALEDGTTARAMLYPQAKVVEHNWPDISHFGGWAAYKSSRV